MNSSHLKVLALILIGSAAICGLGCKRTPPAPPAAEPQAAGGAPAPTNRIDVPAAVRQNLGITFAKVERRRVASTLRVPGRFELLPTARRESRAGLGGRVEVMVKQFDKVKAGDVLYRVDAPEWHRIRLSLHESEAEMEKAAAAVTVAEKTLAEAESAAAAMESRIKALAGAEVKRAELDAELAQRRAAVPKLAAELSAKQIALAEAKHHVPLQLAAAASAIGLSPDKLTEHVNRDGGGHAARWRTLDVYEVRATSPGVVESVAVSSGAWVEAGGLVMTVIDPGAVRFTAVGLQADMAKLREGLPVTIPPPGGAGTALAGKLSLGLSHDADRRTVGLFVSPDAPATWAAAAWARPGVTTLAEVITEGGDDPEPAIPVASVIRDELTQVFFRRDPNSPDKVIRIEADLGVSDGKWVVVNSGVAAGDEVVVEGVYELKLVGAGKPGGGGGHFHADGTWHANGTPEPGGKK